MRSRLDDNALFDNGNRVCAPNGRQAMRDHERGAVEHQVGERLLDERRPLLKTYEDGLAKLDGTAAKLRDDLSRLSALKEKLVVDLDAVRVNAGLAELEKLRTTEAEIEHFARILGSMGQDVAGSPAREPGPVDIDALLK